VLLAGVLALSAAFLAVVAADWWYLRRDLSLAGRNSLDPAIEDLLERMPEKVHVDVFLRPLARPYEGVSAAAQQRFRELLFVAANAHRDRLELADHDPRDLEGFGSRQRELGVEGVNLVVVSSGGRKTSLSLFGDIAEIDWGNPTPELVRALVEQGIPDPIDPRRWDRFRFEPAALLSFRGAEAFASALAKVASGARPKVYFSVGHAEPDLSGSLSDDLGRLRGALEGDGFEVAIWDAAKTPEVPEDCDVLALVGVRQELAPSTLASLRAYLGSGGRLLAAAAYEELEHGFRGSVVALLSDFGMQLVPGIVCAALAGSLRESVEGTPQCARLVLDETSLSASHVLTEPLRRSGRRLAASSTPSFERVIVPGFIVEPLVTTPRDAWRDLSDANGRFDFRFDASRERREPRALAFSATSLSGASAADPQARGARVLGLASESFLSDGLFEVNRDFALNAFNWLAEREVLVRVTTRERDPTLIDVASGPALRVLTWTLWLGLPGVFVLSGAFVAWRRRRP
jgi:hypothetical protein